MLDVSGIEVCYGETQVLFGVSLTVAPGEVVCLLGPNGAGKTTTLRAILGLTPARAGRIRFDDRDITRATTHDIARAGIGWVPDDRRIFPTLTVERNLRIAMKRTRFRAWSFKEVLESFTALEYLRDRDCENLSGGEMQMVAIARALLGSPGLVLFTTHYLMLRGFYALERTRTVFWVQCVIAGTNIVLAVALAQAASPGRTAAGLVLAYCGAYLVGAFGSYLLLRHVLGVMGMTELVG